MVSVKVKFSPSSLEAKEGTLYYQIIYERRVRRIITSYHVFPNEWDDGNSAVVYNAEGERAEIISSIRRGIRRDMERFGRIVRSLENSSYTFTADDVAESFCTYGNKYSLFRFMASVIDRLKQNGKIRTAEAYISALNSFKKFRQAEDIMLDCITSEIIEDYQASLESRGITPNTISFYMRVLRAVFNRAVELGAIEQTNPFKHVYTGVYKTAKRALTLSVIKKIKGLDLSSFPSLDYARDMFMLSFYLRGMSFIDMAYLRKKDLRNGYITYRRRKTGQLLIIGWTAEMQAILNKYPENVTDYLLPVIRNPNVKERVCYRNISYNINYNLKKIALMVGVDLPLTLYVARHSWASAAKAKGVPLSVISAGMGHDNESTTRIYLASLDVSVIDQANSLIMSSL